MIVFGLTLLIKWQLETTLTTFLESDVSFDALELKS